MNDKWDFKVDLNLFRSKEKNKQRFWNLIYYFNEYHLPYEFVLPYEDKQFERDLKRYEARSKKAVGIERAAAAASSAASSSRKAAVDGGAGVGAAMR